MRYRTDRVPGGTQPCQVHLPWYRHAGAGADRKPGGELFLRLWKESSPACLRGERMTRTPRPYDRAIVSSEAQHPGWFALLVTRHVTLAQFPRDLTAFATEAPTSAASPAASCPACLLRGVPLMGFEPTTSST